MQSVKMICWYLCYFLPITSSVFAESYAKEPPSGFSTSLNNVGWLSSETGKIYTCLQSLTSGELTSINNISKFTVEFSVVSAEAGIIAISKTGNFSANSDNPENDLDCSGSYESTTGLYTDTLLVDSSLLTVSFKLIDPSDYQFQLEKSELIQKAFNFTTSAFSPLKNSKSVAVTDDVVITFNKEIKRGSGKVKVVNKDLNATEEIDVHDAERIKVSDSSLILDLKEPLVSNTNYSIKFPAGLIQSVEGENFDGFDDYDFKTQTDIVFFLLGYNNSTLYPSVESFADTANKTLLSLQALSAGQITSYETKILNTLEISAEYAQYLADLEVVDAAINDWGTDDYSNYFRSKKISADPIATPTEAQKEVLTDLKNWLIENSSGASGWSSSDAGILHYEDWVRPKVLDASRQAYYFLKEARLPEDFSPFEYKVIAFILSSADTANINAAASNFNALNGTQWDIKSFSGLKLTHDQDFFYSDHSDNVGNTSEKLLLINSNVDVHEAIHAWGQTGHDQDPLRIGYSITSQAGSEADLQFQRSPPTYPAYNRVYLMGWLPESAITSDPNLVKDLADTVDTSQKYLLKVGKNTYQELYDGQWFQYSVDSFGFQLQSCKTNAIVGAPTPGFPNWNPANLCKPLLIDETCGIKSQLFGLPETMWDFTKCEFIEPDVEISRELFERYLVDFNGDYNGAVNMDNLTMEITDETLR